MNKKKVLEILSILLFLSIVDIVCVGIWFGIENSIGLSFYLYLIFLFNGTVSFALMFGDKHTDKKCSMFFASLYSLIFTLAFSKWILLVCLSASGVHLMFLHQYLSKKGLLIRWMNISQKIPINLYFTLLVAIALYFFYHPKGGGDMGLISIFFGLISLLSLVICILLVLKKWLFDNKTVSRVLFFCLIASIVNTYLYILSYDITKTNMDIQSTQVKATIKSSSNKKTQYLSTDEDEGVYVKTVVLKDQKKQKVETQKTFQAQVQKKTIRSKELLGILDMRRKLNKQLTLISKAQDSYYSRITKLKEEIRTEKQKYNITQYSNITKRIMYNMKLIQEIDAYNTKLMELKKVTKSGLEESVYMERRLAIKKNMVRVTGNTKSLGKDIEKLLNKYNSYTEDFVIKPEDLKFNPLEEIWKQIDS